jgi:diguanylate cyclase (GGDEF)-like protein
MKPLSTSMPSPQKLMDIIKTQTEIAKTSLDLPKIMDLVAHRAQELTGGTGGVVELYEGGDMVYRAVSGTASNFLGFRMKREGSLSGLCMSSNAALMCNDTELDSRVNKEACRKVGVRSMMLVPLVGNTEVVGVLKVLADQPNVFCSSELMTLQLMSELIGAAIANANERERHIAENQALFVRATSDTLTGLSNRALFYDRLRTQMAAARRESRVLGVLLLDMNGLKQLNDTVGHHAGDAALKELGARVRKTTRESDTVARIGGDEFAVLLAVNDRAGAEMSVKRIATAMAAPFTFDGKTYPLSASIGIAMFPEDSEDIKSLLEKADADMYEKKRAHKAALGLPANAR